MVAGDAFHMLDRVKVPVHHPIKKAYFRALSEAWFVWDERRLVQVKETLRAHGLTQKEIESKYYFDIDFFRQRVPRTAPPPSIQYKRVRVRNVAFVARVSALQ